MFPPAARLPPGLSRHQLLSANAETFSSKRCAMTTSRKSFCCPTCGSHIGEASPVERILDADLTRQQRTIIEALSERVGDWVRVTNLESLIWADRQTAREPNTSRQSISAQISKAQRVLLPLGWFISSDRRGCYRLIPLEKSA